MRVQWLGLRGGRNDRTNSRLDPLVVAPDLSIPPSTSFLLPNTPALRRSKPGQPLYETPLGSMFDTDWIKAARQIRRSEMTKAPSGVVGHAIKDVQVDDLGTREDPESTLQLANYGLSLELGDWEKNIVMCSL